MTDYAVLSRLGSADELAEYLERNEIDLPFEPDVDVDGPLFVDVSARGFEIGNRWAVLPLEGWDSDINGAPTKATSARWAAFGQSGAKLIWGESAAVRSDGRSSPEQLLISTETVDGLAAMRQAAVTAHGEAFDRVDDFKLGIQMTHSGRLSHPAPTGKAAPVTVRHHPQLDSTIGPGSDQPLMSDDELYELIDDYVNAAANVAAAGFDFVDLKACHGYLSHELLGAFERPGVFGGSLENRTRFLRLIIEGVRSRSPELKLALRISAFDTVTHQPDESGVGRPITSSPYRFWFGTDETGRDIDLTEPIALLRLMQGLGVDLICVTGSSPHNAWHFQRPALNSKPTEYDTPEDPLKGVARHIQVTRELKREVPGITTVGSGYSYLQQWLPNVAQAVVRAGATDLVGIARMQIAYPGFIADVMAGRPMDQELVAAAF